MTLIPLLVYMYRINLMHHHTVAMKSMTNQISKFLFHDFFSFCEVCDLKQNVFISRGDNIVMLVSHMCREKNYFVLFWKRGKFSRLASPKYTLLSSQAF